MLQMIQLCYIMTIFLGVCAFALQMMTRAKNLAVTNHLVKGKATALCLLLIVIFNICDFLILFLENWLGNDAVNWVFVLENVLEVGLAYALIEMEREYFSIKENRWTFVFFLLIIGIILWVDTAYTAGILFITEKVYIAVMLVLNLLPVVAVVFFSVGTLRKIFLHQQNSFVEGFFIIYNIIFFFLCLITTVSILDSRTTVDYVVNDKEIYVVFWFLFNLMNLVFVWRSCQTVDEQIPAPVQKEEGADEKILRFGSEYKLSERELEIAQLLCKGKNNNDIAAQLYLSPNTVKVHTSNLYKKLGVKNRVQAVQVLRGEEID